MINKLFLLILLISSLQSADPKKSTYLDVDNPNPTGNKYSLTCPKVLSEYATRVLSYDYDGGKINCNVYGKDESGKLDFTKVIDTISHENPYVKAYLNSMTAVEEAAARELIKNKYKINAGSDIGIKSSADTWFEEFVNTPAEFMTTSKMLIAALTLDGDVIDLQSTLNTNILKTTSEYTHYPNLSNGDPTKKIFDALVASAKARGDIDGELSQYKYKHDFSSSHSKDILGELYVLIVDFFAEFNELYRKVIFWVFILSVFFSVMFYFQNKSTRSASGLHKQEDPYERFILGALIVFFFFIPVVKHEFSNGTKIQQAYIQTGARQLMYMGMDWADEGTRILSKTYLNFIYKGTGNFSASQILNLTKEEKLVDKRLTEHKVVLGACEGYYDEAKMEKEPGYTATKIFPTNRKDDWVLLKDAYEDNEALYPNIPTLSACGNALRKILILGEEKRHIQSNLLAFAEASKNNLTKDRLKILSEGLLKEVASNGVIAAPLIGAADSFFKASDLLSAPQKKVKEELDIEAAKNNTAAKSEEDSESSWYQLQYYATNSPYMMLPGFSNFRETLYTLGETMTKGVVFDIIKIIPGTTTIIEGGILWMSTVIPLNFYKSFIRYLPLLGIIVGSFLTLVFFIISVQIYYIILPFFAAYAFSTNQPGVLIRGLSKFLLISLRPLILVISLVIALLAVVIFQGILGYVIDPFFNVFTAMLDQLSFSTLLSYGGEGSWFGDVYDGFFLSALKGIIHIFVGIAVFYATFYITFYGADIFASLFGEKERGLDIQEHIGNPIDSGTSRVSKPI